MKHGRWACSDTLAALGCPARAPVLRWLAGVLLSGLLGLSIR